MSQRFTSAFQLLKLCPPTKDTQAVSKTIEAYRNLILPPSPSLLVPIPKEAAVPSTPSLYPPNRSLESQLSKLIEWSTKLWRKSFLEFMDYRLVTDQIVLLLLFCSLEGRKWNLFF